MRHIQLEEDLRIRFPSRGAEFDEGVEIGILAALMAAGLPEISRTVASGTIEQLRCLASGLGYRIVVSGEIRGQVDVTLQSSAMRPKLRLVSGS